LLRHFHNTLLPEFYELIYAANPLLPSIRGKSIVNHEPYLVMEFLQGKTLLEITKVLHRSSEPSYGILERLAWQVVTAITDFLLDVSRGEEPCLYCDFTPQNVVITP